MNVKKTGYTCVDERETEMQGEDVVTVDELTYLGSTSTSKARDSVQDTGRVESVEMIFGVICERGIATRVKRKVYKMVARPALIF